MDFPLGHSKNCYTQFDWVKTITSLVGQLPVQTSIQDRQHKPDNQQTNSFTCFYGMFLLFSWIEILRRRIWTSCIFSLEFCRMKDYRISTAWRLFWPVLSSAWTLDSWLVIKVKCQSRLWAGTGITFSPHIKVSWARKRWRGYSRSRAVASVLTSCVKLKERYA